MKKFIAGMMVLGFLLAGCESGREEGQVVESDSGEESTENLTEMSNAKGYKFSVSSVLKDASGVGFTYDEAMLNDNDFSTAWCMTEGDKEKTVTLEFPLKVQGGIVGIVPGFARDESIYEKNNRVKKFKIILDEESIEQELKDEFGMQFIDLKKYQFQKVQFVVEDIYKGSKYNDTCISEINFWSEYVRNQDSKAAMDYYKNFKEKDALRPNDVVGEINVTDYAFPIDKDDLFTSEYEDMKKCDGSIYAPGKTDNFVELGSGLDVYAFAEINEFGRLNDMLSAEWFFEEKHRPLDENGEEDLSADFIHDGWKSIGTEDDVKVFKTCGGNLFAYAKLESIIIRDYYNNESGLGSGGTYKVVLYRNDEKVGEGKFGGIVVGVSGG